MQTPGQSPALVADPTPAQVDRAIRCTYIQQMLGAVFGASTGGMFLIGFALALGANDVLLGLVVSLPSYAIVAQFLAAYWVERGVSRKRMTIGFGLIQACCWLLIALIPVLSPVLGLRPRFALLIGIITLVTLAAHFAANARASWVGDLIPPARRGRFFAHSMVFTGMVGAVFAVIEGRFLDVIRAHGLLAFAALFFFGALFGIATALMNVPQPECPLPGAAARPPFRRLLRDTFRNRPFRLLAVVHSCIALGGIAGPFWAAYCLRDLGMSFFVFGLLNALQTGVMLLTAPAWGRLADRFGCRPVLVLGLLLHAPCAAFWWFVPPGNLERAYWILPWNGIVSGFAIAGWSVALSTLVYKLSAPEGRSVQLAAYSTFLGLIGAPVALLGGALVAFLARTGWAVDLRLTFYLWSLFMFTAALIARRLPEADSVHTRIMVGKVLPPAMVRAWSVVADLMPWGRREG
ncbi:MAG: MFS transporter [Lentisphaerae bacterium]|nr:MFS transporter [Lentisphaerota bacterium]